MFERMLDKQVTPSFDEMKSYCGETGDMWSEVDGYLTDKFDMKSCIRFPYGNKYGWGVKYSRKSKHFCDIFAENGAFMVLIRMSNDAIDSIYNEMSEYAKVVMDNKYPCSNGGWLNYRVTGNEQLQDLMKIIETKANNRC